MNKCLIARSDTYGIPGGWRLTHPALGGQTILERSPEHAVAALEAMLRVNNFATTRDDLWAYANGVWGRAVIASGEADRWMGGPLPDDTLAAAEAPAFMRRLLNPKDYGGVLWGTLHLLPLVWTKDAWMAHIALMTRIIEPGGYEQGCPICAAHWKSFLSTTPPEFISSASAAADWSLRAHNSASSHAGHPQWTWREAAEKWGWPGEWEAE